MLKKYIISDFLPYSSGDISFCTETLESLPETKVEWPHRRDFYSFTWITEGRGINVIDFREHLIQSNRMFLGTPEQIHNWSYYRDMKGYILEIDKSLATLLNVDFDLPYIDIDAEKIPLLTMVFDNLIRDCRANVDELHDNIIISMGYLYSLISEDVKIEKSSPKSEICIFKQFKDLVLTNETMIQSVDTYADSLHISTDTLNEICQTFAGSTAKQLLLDLKITEAKRLLLYSKLNINEISMQLGYEDSSYFTRIFKKKTDLSPSAYKEKHRKVR